MVTFLDTASLLDADEPAPFEIFNPDGRAPVLFVADHASNRIPRCLGGLGLSVADQQRHIAWDIGSADLTMSLSLLLNAPAVLCGYSRLVIDCNRLPGDPDSIPVSSDGTVVPGNCDLSEAGQEIRTTDIFNPYHQAVADTLAHMWRRCPSVPPALLAIHSFTPQLLSIKHPPRPWQVGLLWNRDPRLAVPLMDRLRALQGGFCIGDNQPYSGRDIAFTVDRHAASAGLPHAGIEVRQDEIDTKNKAHVWACRLVEVLGPLVGHPDVHRVCHY
ncbi:MULTISPECIES: N-formylglutamate amidohydrolase [unclassified Haematospirillum]|uniref:N-formylglutamate amidohydrolase n=1 Tax=unclassified Haematospirillum TaxID=2622088 RepID=UPI0014393875|nr:MULTISPECIES: N-formylglutamate amidohydrolase [unclassified Haematospirillum]NKD54404.1 N-formylglutamate amidohydrolase [Haematospirillum sp. H4890]NKD74447.1 N-formylglutamate amidohydrolase [Haematospirillum sp. H4485]NKD86883.1 N-formylglutamate amidohydrolase [Haematospirillum sp. 15-248]